MTIHHRLLFLKLNRMLHIYETEITYDVLYVQYGLHVAMFQGDSGGPLVCRADGDGPWMLQGITSAIARPCGSAKKPSVYTKVTAFLDWIDSTISGTCCVRSSACVCACMSYMCMCVYMCAFVRVCICLCVRAHVCVCVSNMCFTHTHIYIYI